MARTPATRFKTGLNSVLTTGISGDVNNSDDYIDIPGLTYNVNTGSWTIALLLKPLGDGAYYNMTFYAQNDGTGTGRSPISSPLVGRAYSSALGGVTRSSTQLPILNVWQWVVYTYDLATQTLSMYFMIKGDSAVRRIGLFTAATFENATGGHRIGATKNDPVLLKGVRCAHAYFGNFKFFNTALTEVQVTEMCAKNSYSTANLLTEFLFSDTAGSTITGTIGGINGTLSNGAAINVDQAHVPYPTRTPAARGTVTRPQG